MDIHRRGESNGIGESMYSGATAVSSASLNIPTTALKRHRKGGESLRAVQERVVDRFEAVVNGSDEEILVVTHGGPLCILLGHAGGMGLAESLMNHHLDNCE